ncbi:MAG: ChbG/HpnK family deacetylase [Acidobacteria bacterium]|nr:ChbG/HpnK family deacetylase [Acidobacteriota bacterium]
MSELLHRLGLRADRALIVTAADAGLSVAVNEGIRRARSANLISDASLCVVAPFAREAVRRLGPDLGVQLTLSAEHELLELRPVTYAPSLLGGRGGFPLDASDAAEHADPDEVHREFRAQIERAITLGVTPTFLASHDDVVARHLALFDVFLDVAEEYRLPIRHGYTIAGGALHAGRLAEQRGHFVTAATVNWRSTQSLEAVLAELPQGVSEMIVHVAVPSDELRAVVPDASEREATLRVLEAGHLTSTAHELGIELLSWSKIAQFTTNS